jgi:hypothetical protein
MHIEELMAKLIAATDGNKIKILHFSSQAAGLTDAQKALFPTAEEIIWPLAPGVLTKDQTCDVVVLFSEGDWPDGFTTRALFDMGACSVHFCIPQSCIENFGLLLQRVACSSVAVKSIASFESLGLSYVLELARLSSLSDGYISYAISEFSFLKPQNRQRKEQVALLSDEKTILTDEIKILIDDKAVLLKEKFQQKAALEQLSSELAAAQRKHDELVAIKEGLAKHVEKTQSLFSISEVQRDKLKVQCLEQIVELQSIKAEFANNTAKLVHSRFRNNLIKSSFSYRFGNIFALAAKSPKRLLLLPITIFAFLIDRVFNKLRIVLSKKKPKKKLQVSEEKLAITLASADTSPLESDFSFDPHTLTLAKYLSTNLPVADWTAVISSDWLQARLTGYGEFIQLQPNDWQAIFDTRLPERLLVDSLDLLEHSAWRSCLQGGAYGYPAKLNDLLRYCQSRGIETVLWHNAEPGGNRVVAEMASQFSKVYVADQQEYLYLRDTYNVASEKIEFLPLALDGRQCASVAELSKDHMPRIVVGGADDKYASLARDVYAEVLSKSGRNTDQDMVITNSDDLAVGDLCWVPSYPVASGYLSERFFDALESGCIPFNSSVSAASTLFNGCIPVASDRVSLTAMIETVLDAEVSIASQQKALCQHVLEQSNFNNCRKKLLTA